MPSEDLTRIYGRFMVRGQTLVDRFGCPLPGNPSNRQACTPVHRDGRAHQVVRLLHLWGEFSRVLVVRSAMGYCHTRSGRALFRVPVVGTVSDIPKITHKPMAGPRAYWYDPQFAIDCASDLSVLNYNEISLGLGSADLSEIKCVRNFIVHPNSYTNANYLQLTRNRGLFGVDPDTLMSQRIVGGATLFETWIEDLLTAAWNAIA